MAAPTAGLHFTDAQLDALRAQGVKLAFVTLHVGAGTFQPVRVDNIAEHRMHSELYDIPPATVEAITQARASGGRVVAVGTTISRKGRSGEGPASGRPPTPRAGAGLSVNSVTPGAHRQANTFQARAVRLPKSCGFWGSWLVGR